MREKPQGIVATLPESSVAITLDIDTSLFSSDVVLKASYWFTDRAYFQMAHDHEGRLIVEIRPKTLATPEGLQEICGEFCNALIEFALRERVAAETADVQGALLQRAFVELLPKARLEA